MHHHSLFSLLLLLLQDAAGRASFGRAWWPGGVTVQPSSSSNLQSHVHEACQMNQTRRKYRQFGEAYLSDRTCEKIAKLNYANNFVNLVLVRKWEFVMKPRVIIYVQR